MTKFWQSPAYLTYVQPELTDDILSKFENESKFKLPVELINLLKIQNGGYIRFSLPDIVHNVVYGIGPNLPKLEKKDWALEKEYVDFELDGLLPFDGDGHWHLCLDYRENNVIPKVSYIDIECNNQLVIANSFSEYLSLLKLDSENKFVIESNESLDELIKKISKAIGAEFDPPDEWAHGYPIYRAKFKKDWVWISPNKVNRGFIREEDLRFEELNHLIKGEEYRYPELPKSGVVLSFSSEKIIKRISRKLRKKSISILPFDSFIK